MSCFQQELLARTDPSFEKPNPPQYLSALETMEASDSDQRMPSDVPIRVIWGADDDSDVYLETTAAKDELAKEFHRLFGIKFLFFQITLEPNKFQLRYLILDVAEVMGGYQEPELMVLDGSFLRAIGSANLINSPDLLRLRVALHVEEVSRSDADTRIRDWNLGVMAIALLRSVVHAYIGRVIEVVPDQLVTGPRCFQYLHLMDTICDTLVRRHSERVNYIQRILASRSSFLRDLLEKYNIAMEEIPKIKPMAVTVPREIYRTVLTGSPISVHFARVRPGVRST